MPEPVKITLPEGGQVPVTKSDEHPIVFQCRRDRTHCLELEENLKGLKQTVINATIPTIADRNEMIANVMLAYRHLEDARMRLGKVIQVFDGGVSVYK